MSKLEYARSLSVAELHEHIWFYVDAALEGADAEYCDEQRAVYMRELHGRKEDV